MNALEKEISKRIDVNKWVSLSQAEKISGRNAKFIQRKQLQGLIQFLDVWGLNHRIYFKDDVLKFKKEKKNE